MPRTSLTSPRTYSTRDMDLIHAYWRAANYLSVGQIYLLDNPLLREPLQAAQVKPRLLGHWGTTPGLNLLYAHMNRVIKERDLDALFVTGPGHGGPGLVANAYLEGTYSEVYSSIGQDEDGMRALFRQFSFPGGIPSHVAPETPGSIHEGGELGYALVHAYGAAFDNPDLLVLCVVGDGEAETGPLAASWHSNKFLSPVTDGAVLPVLHLNGYKIANPTVLARIPEDELADLMRGYGYNPYFVTGDDPAAVHQELAATLDEVLDTIAVIQHDARDAAAARPQDGGAAAGPQASGAAAPGAGARPAWPVIVLRTPKGWTGPQEVDGLPVEGTWRAHQVPLAETRTNAQHREQLEQWMRSYRPEELFDKAGRLIGELRALAPLGSRRSASPARRAGVGRDLRLRAGRAPASEPRPRSATSPPRSPPRRPPLTRHGRRGRTSSTRPAGSCPARRPAGYLLGCNTQVIAAAGPGHHLHRHPRLTHRRRRAAPRPETGPGEPGRRRDQRPHRESPVRCRVRHRGQLRHPTETELYVAVPVNAEDPHARSVRIFRDHDDRGNRRRGRARLHRRRGRALRRGQAARRRAPGFPRRRHRSPAQRHGGRRWR